MTQIEARRKAKALAAQGIPAIAGSVPLGAWSGHEKHWGIYLLVSGQLEPLETEK